MGLKVNDTARLKARKAEGLDTLEALIAQADKQLCQPESSFCKEPPAQPAAATPRNAPRPCQSGQKYTVAAPEAEPNGQPCPRNPNSL
jgi:hypothetical protein